jgi:thymidine phosphorylase
LIRTKCDGVELSDAQIDWLIEAYTADEIADEQMSALAMAVRFCGLSRRELNRWTRAMINSGERLDFSALSKPTGRQALHRRCG